MLNSFEAVKEILKKTRALIFSAVEDFGMVPVEAMACGTPVIAYGRGGVLESVVEGKTGIFFKERTPQAIARAVRAFEEIDHTFDPEEIRKRSLKFGKDRFIKEFRSFLKNIGMEI